MTRQEILAIAKPILFNTEMVGAIQDNRKTVTRRVVKPQPKDMELTGVYGNFARFDNHQQHVFSHVHMPYLRGDYLYVRETWQHVYDMDDNDHAIEGIGRYIYAASPEEWPHFTHWVDSDTGEHKDTMPWRPSIHMPKEAARLFLRVTDVRVERLQDISTMQIKSEGIYQPCIGCVVNDDCDNLIRAHTCALRNTFETLWDSTVPKKDLDRCGWDANPWVFVISFERVNVDG